MISFRFEGRIVIVEHKYFDNSHTKASLGAIDLVIDNSQPTYESIGVGMYLSLMGTFNYTLPILTKGSSLGRASSSLISVPFHISHL